ncbi:MAG TPA: hypothetical protein VH170_05660 [Chthoniobacterales bacterium]|nr:hypothetical protein [Chthoniobacterales bacterium]
MKPHFQFDDHRFPRTDCFFHSGSDRWRGYWSNDDGQFRRRNVGREYLIEAARVRTKEMAVLGILLCAAAWPSVLVMIEVARLYKSHR